MNRRQLIGYVPVLLAAPAIIGLPSAHAEVAGTRVERLCEELSDAMNDVLFGTFRAIVEPSRTSRCPVLLQATRLARQGIMTDQDAVDHAIHNLKGALMRADPTVRALMSVRDMQEGPEHPHGRLVAVCTDRGEFSA